MNDENIQYDDYVDDHVDEAIRQCCDLKNPKSFFVFAGAGSGKTRSLVKLLRYLDENRGEKLSVNRQQVAVITYTNAACDEICNRIDYNPIFSVSTIHSFLWELIKNQQHDIKQWVKKNLEQEINELEEKQKKGRGGEAGKKRTKQIESKRTRLDKLKTVKRFSYNPNGENVGRDSLNHTEVIKIGTDFIMKEETMQKILIAKFPILLIDESQDTKKELIDALLAFYEKHKRDIIIGMFGDTMQKIYTDGKDNLATCIPDDWEKPSKVMNHRSAKRIVQLANVVRRSFDGREQRERNDAEEGIIQFFIANTNNNHSEIEQYVSETMEKVTGDEFWLNGNACKTLILEHHMAASRLGFLEFFTPLYNINSLKTGVMDGSLPEIKLFTKMITPLIEACKVENQFNMAKIVKQYSPLFQKSAFEVSGDKLSCIKMAEKAVSELYKLWDNDKEPTCIEILRIIEKTELFQMPDRLVGILDLEVDDEKSEEAKAFLEAFRVSYNQIGCYSQYINGEAGFDTHQGVKGLEFERVMVIMDDDDARGFLFSYEKLFGAKEKSKADMENEQAGKDTTVSRTNRLFYVACTRAEKSLALVAYTNNPRNVRNTVISNGWFRESEIVMVG